MSPDSVRYWDGTAWTNDIRASVADVPTTQLPPPGEQAPSAPTASVYTTGSVPPGSGGKVLAIVAAAAVLLTGGVVAIVAAQSPGGSSPSDTPAAQETPVPRVTPQVDLPNFGDWTLEIPDHWLDVSITDYMDLAEENREPFVGGWNVDGRSNNKTSSFIFAYQYPDLDDDRPLQEIGMEYYTGPFAGVDVHSDQDSSFTTSNGYEAWVRTVNGLCDTRSCRISVLIARADASEFSITLRDYSESIEYFDEVLAVFDSIERNETHDAS